MEGGRESTGVAGEFLGPFIFLSLKGHSTESENQVSIVECILLRSPNLPKQVWEIGDAHSSTFLHMANDLPGVSPESPKNLRICNSLIKPIQLSF